MRTDVESLDNRHRCNICRSMMHIQPKYRNLLTFCIGKRSDTNSSMISSFPGSFMLYIAYCLFVIAPDWHSIPLGISVEFNVRLFDLIVNCWDNRYSTGARNLLCVGCRGGWPCCTHGAR